ncbi:BTAD domain-containing putative transcriptional regulator [uncultured Desulfosarcina sp.]|uniref:BTAD domain-containing putative transcriptional regulator n=1 Tax=uncultured Desulfosarcina sp. TaxID=218289 RepID=UPI0029C90743|nr:BTAD domain-containing putative transcriptional regulator [uncultured Desulfosarcina sp.]
MNRNVVAACKITAPELPDIITRPRLFRHLDNAASHTVVWLSAMAGSGKTTCAVNYLSETRQPHVWYQLDASDSDPAAFFQNLSWAAANHLGQNPKKLPLFTPENNPGGEAFAQLFFEMLTDELQKPIWLVFDDYQELAQQSTLHRLLAKGFAAVHPRVRILVISRNDPPPEMAGLRARRRLGIIHADELRFNRSETEQFLAVLAGQQTDDRTLDAVYNQTQGWAAGIVLLSGNLKNKTIDSVNATTILPICLFNYFAVELFNRQTADIRHVLLKTAHLPQMTAADAAELAQAPHIERILEHLMRRHLFIQRTEAEKPVYRYHMLWRRFLIDQNPAHFSQQEIVRLQKKAADILAANGQLEDAAQLLSQAGDEQALTAFILRHAGDLVRGGCHETLSEWLSRLPAAAIRRNPWLCYWWGICRQHSQPAEAQKKLGRAIDLFKKEGSPEGGLLAWSGLVDSIVYEWHFFARLDRWLRWYDRNFKNRPQRLSDAGVTARVMVSRAVAMLIRRPQDTTTLSAVDQAVRLSRQTKEIDLVLRATVWAVTYYAWLGKFDDAMVALKEFKQVANDHADRLPSLTLHWKWLELGIRITTLDRLDQAPREIQQAIESADRSGLFFTAQTLVFLKAAVGMTKGDKRLAQEGIDQLASLLDESHYHGHSVYHHFSGLFQLLWGDARKALAHARKATEIADETGHRLAALVCRIQLAFCLFENKDEKKAWREISIAWNGSRKTGSDIFCFMVLLVKAYFADRSQSPAALRYLRQGLKIGRRNHYVNMVWWGLPRLWQWTAAAALQADIETDYVKELILLHRIAAPAPSCDNEQWPWPFRVRTLGGFRIERHGQPLVFSGKAPQKPLALFKHILACAPDADPVETAIDDLWPRADRESGSSALSTTLNRLRRLLGNPAAIELTSGRLSLSDTHWWIDAIAFEKIFSAASRAHRDGDLKTALIHYSKGLSLYEGEFLSVEKSEPPWLATRREELKKKMVDLLMDYGRCLESLNKPKQALAIYQKGISLDRFEENFYQRLMACCHRLGRYARAIRHYQTCCRMLEEDLGVPPSDETRQLYRNVLDAANSEALL